jgi:ClpP class serine protease
MSDMSGGTSVEAIRQNFRAAMADETVGSILFDVDSPGGYTDGIEELATEIRNARGTKPMVAIANYGMASAALYLGAQADELVASPSSMVGWIGTALIHTGVLEDGRDGGDHDDDLP